MMHVICTAVVEDKRQIENLRDCIMILGGTPHIAGTSVCVEFAGDMATTNKFIELFSHYVEHEIKIL